MDLYFLLIRIHSESEYIVNMVHKHTKKLIKSITKDPEERHVLLEINDPVCLYEYANLINKKETEHPFLIENMFSNYIVRLVTSGQVQEKIKELLIIRDMLIRDMGDSSIKNMINNIYKTANTWNKNEMNIISLTNNLLLMGRIFNHLAVRGEFTEGNLPYYIYHKLLIKYQYNDIINYYNHLVKTNTRKLIYIQNFKNKLMSYDVNYLKLKNMCLNVILENRIDVSHLPPLLLRYGDV